MPYFSVKLCLGVNSYNLYMCFQFMQLCYHSYGGKALLIGRYRYLAIKKEKDGKEFLEMFQITVLFQPISAWLFRLHLTNNLYFA